MIIVLVVDDHQLFRESVRKLLDKEPSIKVEAIAGDKDNLFSYLKYQQPDVLVLDVSLKAINTNMLTQDLSRDFPDVKLLYLSLHQDPVSMQRFMKAGAAAYLLKDEAFERLVDTIKSHKKKSA